MYKIFNHNFPLCYIWNVNSDEQLLDESKVSPQKEACLEPISVSEPAQATGCKLSLFLQRSTLVPPQSSVELLHLPEMYWNTQSVNKKVPQSHTGHGHVHSDWWGLTAFLFLMSTPMTLNLSEN